MYASVARVSVAEPSIRYQQGTLPAPVFGWNTRDPVDGMDPRYALTLDNFVPYSGYCLLRQGYRIWTTLGGEVGGLFVWRDGSQEKYIATSGDGKISEVFNGGNTELATGFATGRWNGVSVAQVLYLFNGLDAPQQYNGTAVSAALWTGPSSINALFGGFVSKQVMFLFEAAKNGFWHSAKGTVTPGALTYFDLDQILPDGGEIVAGGTMTVDGGDGPDDYTCFLSSSGWLAMYRGEDPNQADQWAIVGRYFVGQPLSFPKPVVEMAGDLVVLTVNGYISMRRFIQAGGDLSRAYVFNDNIQPEIVAQARQNGTAYGWQALVVPHLTYALFNVPQGSDVYHQHVVNTQTGAWARLIGWNGVSWAENRDTLLFGDASGNVCQAAFGVSDNGQPIMGEGLTAYNRFGTVTQKHFQQYRTVLETPDNVSINLGLAVDFEKGANVTLDTPVPGSPAAIWNTSLWNVGIWGGQRLNYKDWLTAGQIGSSAALDLRVSSSSGNVEWYSTDITYIPGTYL